MIPLHCTFFCYTSAQYSVLTLLHYSTLQWDRPCTKWLTLKGAWVRGLYTHRYNNTTIPLLTLLHYSTLQWDHHVPTSSPFKEKIII